ncbi:MAG: Bud site selection protein bud4 [Caeruleum heppii]|nr:MAG: Bud site selection protein bud4 [Caeruleum heppii]
MPTQAVQPLRIQKSTPTSSPAKMHGSTPQRPLAEINPTERRRNSPSFLQTTKKIIVNGDSSPFDPSPAGGATGTASPRLFWQGRDPSSPSRFGSENINYGRHENAPPSPTKRSSIENLKRASRVKNSNMFAREHQREYDPGSTPLVERPLAAGRPYNVQTQTHTIGSRGLDQRRPPDSSPTCGHDIATAAGKQSLQSPPKGNGANEEAGVTAPGKERGSPTKSSLSHPGRFSLHTGRTDGEGVVGLDGDSGGERQLPPGKVLHRHAKSVTFDAAPPQVNEYEMTTPDLSSIGTGSREGSYDSAVDEECDESFENGDSMTRDDSFDASLEDTDKTPVVGPEDWRFMSPSLAENSLTEPIEDPFECKTDSPDPGVLPHCAAQVSSSPLRTDSTASSADRRPLPPLPALQKAELGSDSSGGSSDRTAHVNSAQRALPSPPGPSPVSKSEIQNMKGSKLSLEDRVRLMIFQDQSAPENLEKDPNGPALGPNHHQASLAERERTRDDQHESRVDGEVSPPHISRESILRKVKGQSHDGPRWDLDHSTAHWERDFRDQMTTHPDPDEPLPSTEFTSVSDYEGTPVTIKQEEDEGAGFDVYSIPDLYSDRPAEPCLATVEFGDSIVRAEVQEDDDGSHYSRNSAGEATTGPDLSSTAEADSTATPRNGASASTKILLLRSLPEDRVSLPEFASLLGDDDFGLGLGSYMTPSPETGKVMSPERPAPSMESARAALQRPWTPEDQLDPANPDEEEEERSSPESVIRHPVDDDCSIAESPSVPEPVATIKAPGGRLKTRPSVTPADMAAMAATRRQVSGEVPFVPPVPAIPQRHNSRLVSWEKHENGNLDVAAKEGAAVCSTPRASDMNEELTMLDMPVGDGEDDLSHGLDKEFDRLLEAQKRGYLMRQNTKVIVASSDNVEVTHSQVECRDPTMRGTRSAGSSPRKASHERTKSWSVEPWNGKIRQKSVREPSGSPRKKRLSGPVPPLPGQQSNVSAALDTVAEAQATVDAADGTAERGRLFVKVIGVKDLELALPKGERSWFNLTLDNGIHCVQTAWLELGRTASIGQEFELVVQDDLEFTLTLQTEAPKPPVPTTTFTSPTKQVRTPKASTFSRVFTSPKKRKELEKKQQEEEARAARQKQQETQAKRLSRQPTAWDLLSGVVDSDGSFGRSYFCLQEHEKHAYGRPYNVSIACFNEWATEESASGSSVKSKHGGVQRRAPYRIANLDLQILFVPRPKGAKDTDMPKSMNACIRELKEAEATASRKWEGNLSQQGGDCPYWRRRFFKLDGSKLTAYHESTRQPRATINLVKASKLIDDRSALTQLEVKSKGGNRRKSAFAEEEEGYMFVEEGFRVRFANGEVIDFYADSAAEKDGWMKVLGETIGKDNGTVGWANLVLKRERALLETMPASTSGELRPKPVRKDSRPSAKQTLPVTPKSPHHQTTSETSSHHGRSRQGNKPRSMIF